MGWIYKYIPKVNKKELLFIGSLAFLITGTLMLYRASANILNENTKVIYRLAISLPTGIVLYFIIFRKIIFNLLNKVMSQDKEKFIIFEFLGLKNYTILLFMTAILLSIELYKLLAHEYVLTFQATMSVPVFIAALSFFKAWKTYTN